MKQIQSIQFFRTPDVCGDQYTTCPNHGSCHVELAQFQTSHGRIWRVDDGNSVWYSQERTLLASARRFSIVGNTTDRDGETVYSYQRWCDSLAEDSTISDYELERATETPLALAAREVAAAFAEAYA